MKKMTFTIQTPQKEIYNSAIKSLKILTEAGLIKILPHHSSLISAVAFGPVIVTDENDLEEDFLARRGVLMVDNSKNAVSLMVMECDKRKEINPITAKEYFDFVVEQLDKGNQLSEFKLKFLQEEKLVMEKQINQL
jgi:F0F1-type ATP synthase epsilon subunit